MVNTGQPSVACLQCRARRIKCDLARPSCMRCEKYGVTCPGYPEKGLVFRDDTVTIRERAIKKYEKQRHAQERAASRSTMRIKKSINGSNQSSQPSFSSAVGHARKSSPLSSPLDNIVILNAAVAAFLSQWRNPNVDTWWSVLDVQSIMSNRCLPDGSLGIALQAVSLMAMALHPSFQNQDLRSSATSMYGSALRAINNALIDPVECVQDNTLLAVMLTATFENMHEVHDDVPATTHIRGMMSMINARGPNQFQTVMGRRLFLYTYFNWSAIAMPDMAVMPHLAPVLTPPISEDIFAALLEHPLGPQLPAFRLLPLIHRSILLRASSIYTLQLPGMPADSEAVYSILASISVLDEELLAWNSNLPPGWGDSDRLYQVLTTSWFRTHRVFLADLRIRCYQRLAFLTGPKEQHNLDKAIWAAVDTAQNALDEICARLPYALISDPLLRKRKPHLKPKVIPEARCTYLFHASFEYPLLVASMVWTLPEFRQRAINEARKQCASACGLERPRKQYPKVLIFLTVEERARYIQHRIERLKRWEAEEAPSKTSVSAPTQTFKNISDIGLGLEISPCTSSIPSE